MDKKKDEIITSPVDLGNNTYILSPGVYVKETTEVGTIVVSIVDNIPQINVRENKKLDIFRSDGIITHVKILE